MNVSLLKNADILASLSNLLQEKCSDNYKKDETWWEGLKADVRRHMQAASKQHAKDRRQELRQLYYKLSLLVQGSRTSPHPDFDHAIASCQRYITDRQADIFEAYRCRSHCQYLDREQQHSRAFFREHKDRTTATIFDRLVTPDGNVTTATNGIIDACTSYFEELYHYREVDQDSWRIMHDDLKQVRTEDRRRLERDFSAPEIEAAIKKLKLGKTPGPDGIPAEFYKVFWHIIGQHFVAMINDCFSAGNLPPSFSEGIITLLCKDESTKDNISSWRPISLLNTDYKIVTSVIAKRLGTVMSNIVHPSQTCAVAGRSVHDNLTTLRDVLDYIDIKNIPSCLLSLDQRKAFDYLSRSFLLSTFQAFGFGPSLTSKIELLYKSVNSKLCINGMLSRNIAIERGIRQGCPMSPALYVLSIETLACAIRRDTFIKGIPIPGQYLSYYCECLHADDVTTVLSDDRSIRRTLEVFSLYGKASGSELNTEKSKILWLGSWRNRTDNPQGIQSSSSCIKVLGITFGNKEAIASNWSNVTNRLAKEAEKWKRADLSFSAKSHIIKQVLFPLLWFLGNVFPPPAAIVTRINSICFRYFWYPKATESVARAIIRLPKEKGGWNIPDLNAVILSRAVTNTVKILQNRESFSYYFCRYLMGSYAHHFSQDLKYGTFPKSATTSHYYRILINTILRIQRHKSALRVEHLSTSDVAQLLNADSPRQPRSHIAAYAINWTNTWKYVTNKILEPRRADLNWKIAHGALPVRYFLFRYHISRTDRCPSCTCAETLEHTFHGCILPAGVWRAAASLFALPAIKASTVLYHDPIPVNSELINQFTLLITEAKYQIWLARNCTLFEHKRFILTDIMNNIRSQLAFRLRCELQRLGKTSFIRKWTNPPRLCKMNGSTIEILF